MIINVYSSCSFIIPLIMFIMLCPELNMMCIPNYNMFFQFENRTFLIHIAVKLKHHLYLFAHLQLDLEQYRVQRRCLIFSCCLTKCISVCKSVKTFYTWKTSELACFLLFQLFCSCLSTYQRPFLTSRTVPDELQDNKIWVW